MFNENENVLEKVQIVCAHCGEIIAEGEAHKVAGEFYCGDCFDEYFTECECCGDVVPRCDLQAVIFGYDRYYGHIYEDWCERCAENNATRCEECGGLVADDLAEHIGATGNWVCLECLENDYFECAECGEYFPNNEAYLSHCHCGDVCESCHDEEVANEAIHDYHDGPRPLNWNTYKGHDNIYDLRRKTLFVGVELEISGGGEDSDNAREIVAAAGYDVDESIVCEHDGSLDDGFELISTTADVDYHINDYGWKAIMETALDLGYTSHDAGCCGLHVHMDRMYFTDCLESPTMLASLILVNNQDWLINFSRRQYFGYCNFPTHVEKFTAKRFEADKNACEYFELNRLKDVSSWMGGHSKALNFDGHATLEVRFNRGTLNFSTFVATLQFVQLYADAIKFSPTFERACEIDLAWFVKQASKRGYEEFLNYLDKRGITSGITTER